MIMIHNEQKQKKKVYEEEESSEEELLTKTGKTTLSFKDDELPTLPEKRSQRRLRIDVVVY